MAGPENFGSRKSVQLIKQRIKPKDQINPLKSFLGWHTELKTQPERNNKKEKSQNGFDVGATSFASLALDDLDRSLKEKKTLRRCSYKIVLLVRIAGYTPSIHPELPKPDTIGIGLTNFASLRLACLVRNDSRKWKKSYISKYSRWIGPKSKRGLPFKSPNYRLRSLHWDQSGARKSIAKTLLVRFNNQPRGEANISFAYEMLEVWRGASKAKHTPATDHYKYQIREQMVMVQIYRQAKLKRFGKLEGIEAGREGLEF
ncbi:uncharacterized protein PGTG_13294 [Puccinia graminis f. sp. tritici CRL 75-36-700-3]|uniref:Uncharacterized protein n=1 Tax=Puccinia graminis f. sp. tritici (strain CRL 75-36-700-3 / race SCCL) TaxID=418459 RepID=E3KS00_PUCGT|nr:uncharacterized protein PGTG_13294 [Puccinia graminis f. sp. tritici CRL 75-36-700-3]EFP87075.1 hypothetical protein PGTG_13294 [Puccinia graminis f. sp. tritici CRL 75-36-700-3]